MIRKHKFIVVFFVLIVFLVGYLYGNSRSSLILQKKCPENSFTNFLGMTFVLIPSGEFMMGSPVSEIGRDTDEQLHKVIISHSFYMQTTTVTQEQWVKVMEENPSAIKKNNHPVTMVSWNDCKVFIEKLNEIEKTGSYRLPTEAEWEYAARAGSTTSFPDGDITVSDGSYESNLDEYGWYVNNSKGTTHPVGLKKANAWGLYDMHGNVWELCEDAVDWSGESGILVLNNDVYIDGIVDPLNKKGATVIDRGGGYSNFAKSCRSANRSRSDRDSRMFEMGVRLVFKISSE